MKIPRGPLLLALVVFINFCDGADPPSGRTRASRNSNSRRSLDQSSGSSLTQEEGVVNAPARSNNQHGADPPSGRTRPSRNSNSRRSRGQSSGPAATQEQAQDLPQTAIEHRHTNYEASSSGPIPESTPDTSMAALHLMRDSMRRKATEVLGPNYYKKYGIKPPPSLEELSLKEAQLQLRAQNILGPNYKQENNIAQRPVLHNPGQQEQGGQMQMHQDRGPNSPTSSSSRTKTDSSSQESINPA